MDEVYVESEYANMMIRRDAARIRQHIVEDIGELPEELQRLAKRLLYHFDGYVAESLMGGFLDSQDEAICYIYDVLLWILPQLKNIME